MTRVDVSVVVVGLTLPALYCVLGGRSQLVVSCCSVGQDIHQQFFSGVSTLRPHEMSIL